MPQSRARPASDHSASVEIDFIIVGGLSAVLNGVPVQTYDIDLPLRSPAREHPPSPLVNGRNRCDLPYPTHLRQKETHLTGSDHLNLPTTYGPSISRPPSAKTSLTKTSYR